MINMIQCRDIIIPPRYSYINFCEKYSVFHIFILGILIPELLMPELLMPGIPILKYEKIEINSIIE